jgi:hypothetical protein
MASENDVFVRSEISVLTTFKILLAKISRARKQGCQIFLGTLGKKTKVPQNIPNGQKYIYSH